MTSEQEAMIAEAREHVREALRCLEAVAGGEKQDELNCKHPSDSIEDISTMGSIPAKTYRCRDCRFEWTKPLMMGRAE